MQHLVLAILPILLCVVCVLGLALGLLAFARVVRPGRAGRVARMPYESGMDPIHDTRRRFDVRFYLLAIAFLVFDVELLFLYPWAVIAGEQRERDGHSGRRDGHFSAHSKTRRRGEGERGRREVISRFLISPSPRLPLFSASTKRDARAPPPPLRRRDDLRCPADCRLRLRLAKRGIPMARQPSCPTTWRSRSSTSWSVGAVRTVSGRCRLPRPAAASN